MKRKEKPQKQKSPSSAKNSIEAFFERLGTPIENVTAEKAGTTSIIPHNKPLKNRGNEREREGKFNVHNDTEGQQ